MTHPPTATELMPEEYLTDGALEDMLDDAGISDELGPEAADDSEAAPIPGGGALLQEPDPKKVYRVISDELQRQERLRRNREEKGKHWTNVQGGKPFSYLEKSEDRSIYKASVAPGIEDTEQPIPNKMEDLASKIIAQMMVDDYLPNPKPDGDADRDRGAADLTKKFLRNDGTAAGTNDRAMLRDVLGINMTKASTFAYVWVDPTAGGWRPKQIKAHPRATDPKNPMFGPSKEDPAALEKTSSPILRYVGEAVDPATQQKTLVFTENPAEAVRQWLPKHRRRLLYPIQVCTIPQSATVFAADAIILIMYESLGEAKRRFKDLESMSAEQLKKLCDWRPKRWKSIVPEAHRPTDDGGKISDDSLIFWYHKFCRIGPAYPDGAEICVNGADAGVVLKRDTLREDVEVEDGRIVPVLMDPPVAQFLALSDTEDGDAFGTAPMSRFGGGNGAWGHIWAGLLDAMHQALNPNVFIPSTSSVTREDLSRRDGTPIEILTKEDKPTWEQAPQLPTFVPLILEKLEVMLNSAAGTNETSNSLDSRYSISGRAKEIAIKQARVALSQYWQNLVNGLAYYWRIKTQLAQARLTVPQQVKLAGAESAYKQPWWVGGDLVGVSEIALDPGSGTMMAPAEKAQWIERLQANSWLDPEQAGELVRSSMSDDLGLPPNIHEEAVNREIAAWADGPPPGWEETYAQREQMQQEHAAKLQQAVQDTVTLLTEQAAATGQAADPAEIQQRATATATAQLPPPQLPHISSPFEDRPNAEDPAVAVIRHRRLSRMISTAEYEKHSPAWKALLKTEYDRIAYAAGVRTLRQQHEDAERQRQAAEQAAAQAAEAEAAKAAQDTQQKHALRSAELTAKADESERDREHEAQQAEIDRLAQAEQGVEVKRSVETNI